MKRLINVLAVLFAFSATTVAQSGSNNYIPELVFQNPVLVSGTAGQNGAVYKFSNVATGVDATVKIVNRSSSSVKLTNIDVAEMGWKKAFQPQLGIAGNVPANQDWWMDFEMRFYNAGTSQSKNIKGFSVTAIDVDGDGVSIREYLQMNRVKSVTYCPVNYLASQTPVTLSGSDDDDDDDDDDNQNANKRAIGPVQNFYNIDTLGTPVMATYKYENKSSITFRYGAKSGSIISNAGERLNSLWFKAFTLTPPATLPVIFSGFTASYDKKNAFLNWTAQADELFSHFEIEKSTDGVQYTKVGEVKASISTTSYSFTDAAVSSASGMAHYRIVCKEKTGETSYSAIRSIRLVKETSSSISVYPNPVYTKANLTLPQSWQNKPVLVSVYNSTGVQVKTISIRTASQTESLDFQQFPKGIYIVKAQCADESSEQRILRN